MRVLVVDDDADIIRLLGIKLSKEGHEVTTARDGTAAAESHAPLIYVEDPRDDLPGQLGEKLVADLDGADERIIKGWLGTGD